MIQITNHNRNQIAGFEASDVDQEECAFKGQKQRIYILNLELLAPTPNPGLGLQEKASRASFLRKNAMKVTQIVLSRGNLGQAEFPNG